MESVVRVGAPREKPFFLTLRGAVVNTKKKTTTNLCEKDDALLLQK